jgi:hypothetical protein
MASSSDEQKAVKFEGVEQSLSVEQKSWLDTRSKQASSFIMRANSDFDPVAAFLNSNVGQPAIDVFTTPSARHRTSKSHQRVDLPIRIFLIRHAMSQANIDPMVLQQCSDHAIPLSEEGYKQAQSAGEFLRDYLQKNPFPTSYSPSTSATPVPMTSSGFLYRSNTLHMGDDDLTQSVPSLPTTPRNEIPNNFQARVKMYISPYKRARDTAAQICKAMGTKKMGKKKQKGIKIN